MDAQSPAVSELQAQGERVSVSKRKVKRDQGRDLALIPSHHRHAHTCMHTQANTTLHTHTQMLRARQYITYQ